MRPVEGGEIRVCVASGTTQMSGGGEDAMERGIFIAEHKVVLDRMLIGLPGVRAGKMFGYPGYYVGKKLFACVYGQGVGLKLPEHQAGELLALPHITAFQPLGRPRMREWIQINRAESCEYLKDLDLFMASIAFVGHAEDASLDAAH